MAKSRLHELSEHGVAVWFDTLARDLVRTGELKRMMDEDAVTGVTSNRRSSRRRSRWATPMTSS
jgi:transaldolase